MDTFISAPITVLIFNGNFMASEASLKKMKYSELKKVIFSIFIFISNIKDSISV